MTAQNTPEPNDHDVRDGNAVRVPVVLPLVEVDVDETGSAAVSVDREPYDDSGELGRTDIDRVLHDIADRRGPVRVHVTENDGSEFTDIVIPAAASTTPAKEAPRHPVCVDGSGFRTDSDVAIAVVVYHHQADSDGVTRLRLPPAVLCHRELAIALLDRTTGRFTLCDKP